MFIQIFINHTKNNILVIYYCVEITCKRHAKTDITSNKWIGVKENFCGCVWGYPSLSDYVFHTFQWNGQ